MHWRCNWEPDECTPLSSEWSETILGYCQSPMHLILQTLGESSVPKVVLKSGRECDSIQEVCGFFVKKSSSAPQVCSKLNALKTCKKQSPF